MRTLQPQHQSATSAVTGVIVVGSVSAGRITRTPQTVTTGGLGPRGKSLWGTQMWTKGKRRNADSGDWSALRIDLQSLVTRYYLTDVRSVRALAAAVGASDRTVRKHLSGESRPSVELQDRYRAWVINQSRRVGGREGIPLPPSPDGARARSSERAAESLAGPGNPPRTRLKRFALSGRQRKEIERGRMMHIVLPDPPQGQDLATWARSVLDLSLPTRGEAVIERCEVTAVTAIDDGGGTGSAAALGRIPTRSQDLATLPADRLRERRCLLLHVGRRDVVDRACRGQRAHIESRPQWPGVINDLQVLSLRIQAATG